MLDATSPPNARVSIRVEREDGRAVLFVEDNGSGIAELSYPGYPTPSSAPRKIPGTGIGLSVARELVEKNGGRISVRNGELSGGVKTSFRIEFPVSPLRTLHRREDSA